jgi:hypothetical protein
MRGRFHRLMPGKGSAEIGERVKETTCEAKFISTVALYSAAMAGPSWEKRLFCAFN